ncbi:hypothetical protein ABXW34_24820 [Streptococcus suis]
MDFYNLKQDNKYCYQFGTVRRYSQQLVDFILEKIKIDADIINKILVVKKR